MPLGKQKSTKGSGHAGFKDYPAPGPSLHQRNKLLRPELIDASPFQNPSLHIKHTQDAVTFVVVDAIEAGRLLYDRLCFLEDILHPRFYAAPRTASPVPQAAISLSCRLRRTRKSDCPSSRRSPIFSQHSDLGKRLQKTRNCLVKIFKVTGPAHGFWSNAHELRMGDKL